MKRAIACLMLASAGCQPHSAQPERPLIQIGFTRYLTMAPIFIASEEGYFEELGIEVELVPMRSAAVSIPALAQDRLDVLPGPMSPSLFNAIHRGAPIRLVMDKGTYTLDGCSHKVFGVSLQIANAGSAILPVRSSFGREPFSEFGVERALARLGFDMDDVEPSHIPMAARYDALSSGRIDGAILNEPFTSRFREDGGAVLFELNELLADYQYSVFAFGPRLIEHEPELGKRVAQALLKGVRRFNEGAIDSNVAILAEALGWDESMLKAACWPPMRNDGLIDATSIASFQEWALEQGSLDALLTPQEYWEPQFAEAAVRALDGSP